MSGRRIKDWWRGRGPRARAAAAWRNAVAGWLNDYRAEYPVIAEEYGRSVRVSIDPQAPAWQHAWQILVRRDGADWEYQVLPGRVYLGSMAEDWVEVDALAADWREIPTAGEWVWLHIAITCDRRSAGGSVAATLTVETGPDAWPYWEHDAGGATIEHILVGSVELDDGLPVRQQYLRTHLLREAGANLRDQADNEFRLAGDREVRLRARVDGTTDRWLRLLCRIDHGRVVVLDMEETT